MSPIAANLSNEGGDTSAHKVAGSASPRSACRTLTYFDGKLDPPGYSKLINSYIGLTVRQRCLAYEFVCEAAENAIAHSRNDRSSHTRYEVSAHLSDEANAVVFSVRDWGVGIPASIPKISCPSASQAPCPDAQILLALMETKRGPQGRRGQGLQSILNALGELRGAEVSISSGRGTAIWCDGARKTRTLDHTPIQGVLIRFSVPLETGDYNL